MNRLYMMLLMLGAFLAGEASGYQWLTFTFTDNTQLSVAAEGLQIDYDQANLKLSSAKVSETLPVAELASMRFTDAPSGIESGSAELEGKGVDVFTLQGVEMGRYNDCDEVRDALPSGVYIIKQNAKSIKVIF